MQKCQTELEEFLSGTSGQKCLFRSVRILAARCVAEKHRRVPYTCSLGSRPCGNNSAFLRPCKLAAPSACRKRIPKGSSFNNRGIRYFSKPPKNKLKRPMGGNASARLFLNSPNPGRKGCLLAWHFLTSLLRIPHTPRRPLANIPCESSYTPCGIARAPLVTRVCVAG